MQNVEQTNTEKINTKSTGAAGELDIVDLDATYYTDDSATAEAQAKAFSRYKMARALNALTAVSIFLVIIYGFVSLMSFLGSP